MRLLRKKEEAEIVKALRDSVRLVNSFAECVASYQKIVAYYEERLRLDAASIEELRGELRLKQAISDWKPVSTSVH
jgi:hypothetical protein